MARIQTHLRVARYSREWDSWQDLIKEWRITIRSISIRIWSTVVDTEQIPRHVYIGYLAFGDFGSFRSKFIEHITPKGHESQIFQKTSSK